MHSTLIKLMPYDVYDFYFNIGLSYGHCSRMHCTVSDLLKLKNVELCNHFIDLDSI